MRHLVFALLWTTFAAAGAEEGSALPGNLQAGPFRENVQHMWQTSATFRLQCARISAQRGLTVRLRAEWSSGAVSVRARTEFFRRDGVLIRADVIISDPRDRFELIGHELEHVLEQLEGVQLTESRCAGHTYYTSTRESCRAIEAGRRIGREVEENR